MKVPTNTLFELIQSMSASEKRYFKRHYASEKNLTTELFDYINGLSSYDETEVKKQFQSTKLAKNLKVYKVQLSDLLLKSLVSYHGKKSVRSKIRQGLEEIDILLSKQLFGPAVSKCKRLRELAESKQEYEHLLPILQYEIYLNTIFNNRFDTSSMPQLDKAISTADSVINLYELKKINFRLSDLHNRLDLEYQGESIEAMGNSLLEKELKTEHETDGLIHKYYRNSSKAIIHKMALNNPEQEYAYKKANVEVFKNHSELVESNINTYFAAHYNFLVCCRAQGKQEELKQGLVDIRKMISKHPSLKRNIFYVLYLETKNAFVNRDLELIVNKLEPESIQHIDKFKRQEDNLTALILTYFILTNMAMNNFQQVHHLLRRLYSDTKGVEREYLQMFDLLEIISNLETNDQSIALKLIHAHRRKIRASRMRSNTFFKHCLEAIHNLIKSDPYHKDKILQEYFSGWQDKFGKDKLYILTNEFFLKDWLIAIRNGQTLGEQFMKLQPS